MVKYEPLDPAEARRIEKEAVEKHLRSQSVKEKPQLPPA